MGRPVSDAETLRRAAEKLRWDYGSEHQHGVEVHFHLAVADLLDQAAELLETATHFGLLRAYRARERDALAVARTYLGETS